MCEVLFKLEQLTPDLPPVPQLSNFKEEFNDVIVYRFKEGVVRSSNVYSEDDIAIAKSFIPNGVTFDMHSHKYSREWVIVLEGLLKLTLDGEELVLDKYDSIKIEADKPHSAKALQDTTIIAITIPKDDGFPE